MCHQKCSIVTLVLDSHGTYILTQKLQVKVSFVKIYCYQSETVKKRKLALKVMG